MIDFNENKEGKRNGLITTIVVHVMVLILCIFLGFTYYDPPKGDVAIGFEALGEMDAGKTNDLATSENVTEEHQEVEQTPVTSSNQVEQEVATQESSPVTVNKSTSNQEKNDAPVNPEKASQPVKEEPRKVDSELANAMGSLMQGPDKSGGKGDGNKDGNEGSKNGVPSGEGQGGTGKDGMFDFGGRSAISPGNLRHDCGVQGIVHVRVQVNRQGKVISARMESGGTSYNPCLIKKAEAAARATKYTPKDSGAEIQEGIIKLRFKLN